MKILRLRCGLSLLCSVAILLTLFVAMMLVTNQTAEATLALDNVNVVAGREITQEEWETISDGFAQNAKESWSASSGIETKREIILSQTYTDSVGSTMLVYNFAEDAYFAVEDEFYTTYVENDNFRRLGAPVTSSGEYKVSGSTSAATISSATYMAQIFETGVILLENGNYNMYVGGVEITTDGYKLHPVIDDQDILENDNGEMTFFGNIDGELHPLKDADFFATDDGYEMYVNYRSCCAYIRYDADYNITYQLVSAAYNYFRTDSGYEKNMLPSVCYDISTMICDGSSPVDSDALKYFKTYNSEGTSAQLIALFSDCYQSLLDEGFVAGYRCSKIKMWDLLVLDLRFGDSTTGFDDTGSGERERLTCMVYNPDQNKVYPVHSSYFLIFKEDSGIGRNTLGAPASGILKNKTIGDVEFEEIQIFQYGYIYRTELGNYVGVTGYEYDAENNVFLPIANPDVPDRFGEEIARKTIDDVVYINYERGAITCTLTANRAKYYYTCHAGRNFDFESEDMALQLLSLKSLLTLSQLQSEGSMPVSGSQTVDFETNIKLKLYQKYIELYEQGFVLGFVEEKFKGSWNGVYAQQFVCGDSTAMIFGEERPYVSALVYNVRTDSVYVMKDAVIKIWQQNYGTAGAPTSDEFQVEGYDYWFQTFDFGMTIRLGNLIIYSEDFNTADEYIQYVTENSLQCPTHNQQQSDGYIN